MENLKFKNRAEEYGFDNWSYFIIPPYFREFKLSKSNKPLIIEGGRGSGKTMLLRFLCHQSQFSTRREDVPDSALEHIGIYWKIDTQFSKLMDLRNKDEKMWLPAFVTWGVLNISIGVIESLYSIANSAYKKINLCDIESIDFSVLSDYDKNMPSKIDELRNYLKTNYRKFQVYISNLKDEVPNIPKDFLVTLIGCITNSIHLLKDSVFDVYIDEYENLLGNQCRIINTWIKSSEIPLVFNIAMKKNAMKNTYTLSDEQIVDINDYRKVELDKLVESNFKTFAPEIFLMELKRQNKDQYDFPIKETDLFSSTEKSFKARSTDDYKNQLNKAISSIFPSKSLKEIAKEMLGITAIQNKIEELLNSFFSEKQIKDILNVNNAPESIIILPALVNRPKAKIEKLLQEFKSFQIGKSKVYREWIKNNLFGCILFYYGALNKICPLYSGFEAFITMSKDNIRYFLELCFKSLTKVDNDKLTVQPENQAIAVCSVSETMFREIKSLGNRGNELYTFALRLGTYFEEARKAITQSEPEQNHFNIKDNITNENQDLLDELVKWSVLYEYKLTKQKNTESGFEYLLNPIYSPCFTISYRKKRRLPISNGELYILAKGTEKEFENFLANKFKKRKKNHNKNYLRNDQEQFLFRD